MAKKSIIERISKVRKIRQKYRLVRLSYNKRFIDQKSFVERLQLHIEIQSLPRIRTYSRVHNQCQISGRLRGYHNDFQLSRHFLRELINQGVLPGLRMSSW